MFTGLIEEIGIIAAKSSRGNGLRFGIRASLILKGLAIGDSVAINGVCQTVTDIRGSEFSFDTVEETLAKTTLGSFSVNRRVNLERALRADSRLGGHFVLGHVDTAGTVASIAPLAGSYELSVSFPAEFSPLLVPVGSIAVDGVSLTVARTAENVFTVAIIPHTWESTTLALLHPGAKVNLEFDILGKYVQKMLGANSSPSAITAEWIKKLGY